MINSVGTAEVSGEKVKAMELKDTVLRSENSLELVKDNISMIAAKLGDIPQWKRQLN